MAKFSNFFRVVTPRTGTVSMADSQVMGDQGLYANYSWYQHLVQGSASRITRYREYDLMDNDVEIARSLDTIAEEMIGSNPNDDMPLVLNVDADKQQYVNPITVSTLKSAVAYWCDLHNWHTRLFKVARITAKYGDCFFIRRKEAQRWEYVHPKNVVAAVVDEFDMTRVIGWQIRRDAKVPNAPVAQSSGQLSGNLESTEIFPADQVIVFTLNDDMSEMAPFGESVLRAVYRAQKQKELLEDAILIYRIQRAPERRVFYIDVGKMEPRRVKSYLEGIRSEIRQRKVPTSGGGVDQVDSVYNPQSMSEDFFFASRPDGKGSRVETLPGGQGLGELSDLEYFQWKVFRGLRIPLSYTREGTDGVTVNDGKVGTAYIQELRFAMYIQRLQGYIASTLDREFKRYLRQAGINIDTSIFSISLPSPENFGVYRQQELDASLLNTFQSASGIQFLSPRFTMSKYLQLSDEEIATNEKLRREELGLDPNGGKADLKTIYGQPTEGGMMGGAGPSMVAGMPGMDTGMPPDVMAMGDEGGMAPDVGGASGMDAGAPPV